jgi:hypothetical protein
MVGDAELAETSAGEGAVAPETALFDWNSRSIENESAPAITAVNTAPERIRLSNLFIFLLPCEFARIRPTGRFIAYQSSVPSNCLSIECGRDSMPLCSKKVEYHRPGGIASSRSDATVSCVELQRTNGACGALPRLRGRGQQGEAVCAFYFSICSLYARIQDLVCCRILQTRYSPSGLP